MYSQVHGLPLYMVGNTLYPTISITNTVYKMAGSALVKQFHASPFALLSILSKTDVQIAVTHINNLIV